MATTKYDVAATVDSVDSVLDDVKNLLADEKVPRSVIAERARLLAELAVRLAAKAAAYAEVA